MSTLLNITIIPGVGSVTGLVRHNALNTELAAAVLLKVINTCFRLCLSLFPHHITIALSLLLFGLSKGTFKLFTQSSLANFA